MSNPKVTVLDIKSKVKKYQGQKVRLEAHKSKKKLYQKTGYIEAIYPSIFTISIENEGSEDARTQRMSFSYIDVLTKNVKIDLLDLPDGDLSL